MNLTREIWFKRCIGFARCRVIKINVFSTTSLVCQLHFQHSSFINVKWIKKFSSCFIFFQTQVQNIWPQILETIISLSLFRFPVILISQTLSPHKYTYILFCPIKWLSQLCLENFLGLLTGSEYQLPLTSCVNLISFDTSSIKPSPRVFK